MNNFSVSLNRFQALFYNENSVSACVQQYFIIGNGVDGSNRASSSRCVKFCAGENKCYHWVLCWSLRLAVGLLLFSGVPLLHFAAREFPQSEKLRRAKRFTKVNGRCECWRNDVQRMCRVWGVASAPVPHRRLSACLLLLLPTRKYSFDTLYFLGRVGLTLIIIIMIS